MSFDELLQRDLNDSRVAHDLIPYLISEIGDAARFFPPVLVILVPKNISGSGIDKFYPPKTESGTTQSFGTLFDFTRMELNKTVTPFAEMNFNPQRSAFIIVDGQHRAMAVLALHRQLTRSWGNSNFESYYKHIDVNREDVRNIELPVCIIFFPELTEENAHLRDLGLSLDKACRKLFLVVNRKAQPVSQARNLLLDDEDFAALMMRRTLSNFKDRNESIDSLGRIYSFRYGDSDEEGKTVQTGKLEYSSAIALHKLHCIGSFGNPKGFTLDEPADLSSGTNLRNPDRPADILLGTELEHWDRLGRTTAKNHAPKDIISAVDLLGGLNDVSILKLFDEFRPFAIQNSVMRQLRTRLGDLRSDPIQNRCLSLLFEGSGAKDVFDEHIARLESLREELESEGRPVSDYIKNQLKDGLDVQKALQTHEKDIRRQRACAFFNIRYDLFYSDPSKESQGDQQTLEQKARSIFDAVSTQAFQIGYLASVLSLTQMLLPNDASYQKRKAIATQSTDLTLTALNAFFPPSPQRHETLTGLVKESRVDIFSTTGQGLRGLLGLSVNELNEKQWPFFRYAIYEILFSKAARKAVLGWIRALDSQSGKLWAGGLKVLSLKVKDLRDEYTKRGVQRALGDRDFEDRLRMKEAELQGAVKPPEDITNEIQALKSEEQKRVEALARENIVASTGAFNSLDTISQELDSA